MTISADAIRRRMRQVRCELGGDMDQIVDSSREMADWRAYIRRYPWIGVGVAAAVGYLIVPKRGEVEFVSPDANALLELAKKNRWVVKTNAAPKAVGGVGRIVFHFLANAALRSGLDYAGRRLGRLVGDGSFDGIGGAVDDVRRSGIQKG